MAKRRHTDSLQLHLTIQTMKYWTIFVCLTVSLGTCYSTESFDRNDSSSDSHFFQTNITVHHQIHTI